jgi:hypothetical protein
MFGKVSARGVGGGMWVYAKQGWQVLRGSWLLLLFVFLLQYLSSMVLLQMVKSVVTPLLYRYPGGSLDDSLMQLFVIESQFRLMKTDLLEPVLWTLGAFVFVRMVLTPIINSGLNYALLERSEPQGFAFVRGVRKFVLPFSAVYAVQTLLLLAPLFWLIPPVIDSLTASFAFDWVNLLFNVLPYVAGWLIWQALVKLACLYAGFGVITGGGGGGGVLRSVGLLLRRGLVAVGLGLSLFAIYAGVTVALFTLSLLWAGLMTMVIYLLLPFVRTGMKIWHISAQQHLFMSAGGGDGMKK